MPVPVFRRVVRMLLRQVQPHTHGQQRRRNPAEKERKGHRFI